MRCLLPYSAAILAGLTAALVPAGASSQERRLARQPLPPETVYRDPAPRFRAGPPATFAVRAYVPRPTYQPMFNAPPERLR